jgi:hypothetical protein
MYIQNSSYEINDGILSDTENYNRLLYGLKYSLFAQQHLG